MNDRQSTALGICQLTLAQRQSEQPVPLNGQDIASEVDKFIEMSGYEDLDRQSLIRNLEQMFTVYAPDHQTIGSGDDHQPWLPAKQGAMVWRYWDRYKKYLAGRLPQSGVESIDRVTGDVLERLEYPRRSGMWDRRGLVMGNVQSGKTANYCGLICKAADAGYEVVIVFSGIHNSLRSQTQIRLDEGFLGFMSEPLAGGKQAFRRIGVGLLDRGIVANTATNRTERGDFNRTVANQFGIQPGGKPLLFVIKKNVSVLKNLNRWIASHANAYDPETKRHYIREVPVLVIDDEADLASVDTRKQAIGEDGAPDPDHDPAKTNEQIRLLLRAFEKVAFVGYTATPFANIYIYEKSWTPRLGDDLFPRSFIVSIPPPSNYIGPARVFGIAENEDVGLEEVTPLPVVREVEDNAETDALDETRGWMPPRLVDKTQHKPLYRGEPVIPPSLREAMFSFVLSATVKKIRRCDPRHSTMLVHVVRYTNVQERVAVQVEVALKEIVQRLEHGDGGRHPSVIEEFKGLWVRDFEPTSEQCRKILQEVLTLPEWSEIEENLLSVASSIRVKIINGSAGDVLDYEVNREAGMNLIAIGGDKLSRGLTLEGLTTSYFLRASRMYDTLMQMGRWFGYRDHYADLCRLYTSAELVEWLTHIAAASEELRREFEHMVNVGGTPRDYGLKIRSHPALLVTSAVKMRSGTRLKLSFAGTISETIIFRRDPKWLRFNMRTMDTWLDSLGKPTDSKQGSYNWRNIDSARILDFLSAYETHPDALRASSKLLANYIRRQNELENKELTDWTVRLCGGDGDECQYTSSKLGVRLVIRQPHPKKQTPSRYTIRRLVNPSDEAADLDSTEYEKALSSTVEHWEKSSRRGKTSRPKRPGGPEIRENRDVSKGLMLLYPLDPVVADLPGGSPAVLGVALSFPKSDNAKEVEYIVDNIFMRQGGDDDSL